MSYQWCCRIRRGTPRFTPRIFRMDIVYEDDDVLLVNKVAGMVVHPGYNNYTGTLVNALTFYFQQLPTMPGNDGRPGLVHRIDKDTSGLLLISKNERSMTWLARQFYEHTITRKYIALVWGDLAEDGTVDRLYRAQYWRQARNGRYMTDPEKGKWSVTHYKVLEANELRYADRMPAGNRPYPSDQGTHETHWSPIV